MAITTTTCNSRAIVRCRLDPQVTVVRAAAIVFCVLMLGACMPVESSLVAITPEPSASVATTSALDEMASVFHGDYSREEIKARLDASLVAYGLEPTEDNYRIAADVLITLSTNAMGMGCEACTEMAIIELIASRSTIGADWHSAATIAAQVLAFPPVPSGAIPQ